MTSLQRKIKMMDSEVTRFEKDERDAPPACTLSAQMFS
jgi:hypothetical protein